MPLTKNKVCSYVAYALFFIVQEPVPIFDYETFKKNPPSEGVLFLTYTMLARDGTIDAINDWLGNAETFDGLVVFDECHK